MSAPEQYRPDPSGRFAVNLSGGTHVSEPLGDAHAPASDPTPAPVASPTARVWTVILGLLMIVACGVIVRDILLVTEVIDGQQLLPSAFDWLATLSYDTWMLWAGVGCAFMALILLISTVRPRTRTHIAVGAEQRVFGRPIDFARMSTSTARRIPGVVDAQSVVTRRKIKVTVQSTATPNDQDEVRGKVQASLETLAERLTPTPEVTVTVTPATSRSDS